MHFSYQEREKKEEEIQTSDHRRQSNYYPSTHDSPCGRGHGCASKETTYS
jgi:hypothetical protein